MKDKFNENLREARLRKKLTQQQVADKLGIAKSTYCQYETGASEPFPRSKIHSNRILIPNKKAPQNAKYSALRGILSAGSGGRTRTSHWKIADCDVIMPISVSIHIVFADFGM